MSSHPLSPSQAAAIADAVYEVRLSSLFELRERSPGRSTAEILGCGGLFEVGDSDRFDGRAGALLWRSLSGFGYCAMGVGARAGEALIATRGTSPDVADWLTDAKFAFQVGPSGRLVHAGFNETWRSFSEHVDGFLRQHQPRRLHCVGHSLGGALAMLNAEIAAMRGYGEVVVYTFGAPRVGDWFHRQALVRAVGADNFYRVFDIADPVPMVPLFPYFHVDGIALDTGKGPIAFGAHSMTNNYATAVAGTTWEGLRAAGEQRQRAIERQEEFDDAMARSMLAPMGSAYGMYLIGKAMAWLIKKALLVVGGTLLVVSATLLDRLAWLVSEGASRCAAIARDAGMLLGAVMRFLGRAVAAVSDLGIGFVRWVLGMLWQRIRDIAIRAVQIGNARG